MVLRVVIILSALLVLASERAAARTVLTCPAMPDERAMGGFAVGPCEETALYEADPQDGPIWLLAEIEPDPALLAEGGPVGLALSAKASSAVWLNGAFLGANGRPAAEKAEEVPGLMDAIMFVPRERLRPGVNEVRVLMSSHKGLLHLGAPVHRLGFRPYAAPTQRALEAYWPALATFGAFAAGCAYFGMRACGKEGRGAAMLLGGLCFFAGAQLLAEIARGVFNYPYPVHDVRLLAIAAFSGGFGMCLCAYVLRRVGTRRRRLVLGGAAALTLLAVLVVPGFDGKAVAALSLPTFIAAGGAWRAALKGRRQAWPPALALTVFLLVVFASPWAFLDGTLFFAVTALVLFLLGQEARLLGEAQKGRREAAARAAALALALEQASQREEAPRFAFSGSGAIDSVPLSEIAYFKAAGDYAEAHLTDGTERLAGKRLSEIEAALPSTFLRVHRSYLVNLSETRRLERSSSGTGQLFLRSGATVPVSRRIMPTVRKTVAALTEAGSTA